jgi:hypothetical protein
MPIPDLDRISKLVKKLDDLCREAAEIRYALARTAEQPAAWPAHQRVVPLVTESIVPSDFLPTSTVESAKS